MAYAYIAAIAYSCLVGFSFMFVKFGLQAANSWDLLAWRYIAAMVVGLAVVATGKVKVNLRARDFLPILPLALFYPILFFAFQTLGLMRLPSSEAGIITATVPIFALILAAFVLGERATSLQIVFVVLSVAGVAFISAMKGAQGDNTNLVGIAFILAATFSQAGYNVLARKKLKNFAVFDLTFGMTVIAFVAFVAMALGNHLLKGTTDQFFAPLGDRDFVMAILYLGPLSSLCTSLLANYALVRLEAFRMSVFNNLATVVSMIAGFFFLREHLYWYHFVGAAVIICGVVGTSYFGRKAPKTP